MMWSVCLECSEHQVCFLGRSNVGKSSLISVLLNAHPQVNVRVSKKPGHTKTVNLFRLGRRFTLVDMPGYGYNMPRNFQQSVEVYLSSSRRLCRTFLLVDGVAGLTSTDVVALDMLREFGVPFTVVMTKIDKAGRHKLLQNVLAMMKTCEESGGHGCFSQPFLVSSKTGDGLILLQTFIAYITGCIAVQGL
ncbi:GTP-binding protein 8-like [Babylonia areolata]|uniref:GTP-binding protein 8-like n=1 Tax=Babylonia areolata TaxID=304850 RepID=UPI003FD58164